MQQLATTDHIDGQLAALETAMADFEAEAERLSLGAVSGDTNAIDALATVHAKIVQASTDRTVLTAARVAAAKIKNTVSAAQAEAERARQMEIARDHAGNILTAARRVDDLAAELRALLAELAADERAVWAALRKAGQAPSGGILGQQGIDAFALDVIVNAHRPAVFRPLSIAARAQAAWGKLLKDADDE